jgi:nucleoside-diphosphate-sugar epimerase
MARVLVTGGNGFIGRNLIEMLLFRGHQVRCLVRKPQANVALQDLGAELVQGDLTDEASVRKAVVGVEIVYHLAGLIAALSKQELFRVNAEGTRILADACAAQPTPPLLLLVSSMAAAGPAPRGQLRQEADPPAPISEYGESKLAGEVAAIRYADRLPLTIVRPGVVFGPHDKSMLGALKTMQRFRIHPVPGFKNPPLSWIYVDDLNELIIKAAAQGERVPASAATAEFSGTGTYFGVVQEHPTYADFGVMARPKLHRPYMPIIYCPSSFSWMVASLNEKISSWRQKADVFNRDKIREALAESWACTHEKAHLQLSFEPAAPLQTRVDQTIEWYKQQRWLW